MQRQVVCQFCCVFVFVNCVNSHVASSSICLRCLSSVLLCLYCNTPICHLSIIMWVVLVIILVHWPSAKPSINIINSQSSGILQSAHVQAAVGAHYELQPLLSCTVFSYFFVSSVILIIIIIIIIIIIRFVKRQNVKRPAMHYHFAVNLH